MRALSNRWKRDQSGFITLLVTILLLLAITIGSYSLVNASAVESRMTANDRRGKEAFHAAQAGIDFVLANLAPETGNPDKMCAVNTRASYGFELNFTGPDESGALTFDDQHAVCASMFSLRSAELDVWARGYSNDGESMRTVFVTIDLKNLESSAERPRPLARGSDELPHASVRLGSWREISVP